MREYPTQQDQNEREFEELMSQDERRLEEFINDAYIHLMQAVDVLYLEHDTFSNSMSLGDFKKLILANLKEML